MIRQRRRNSIVDDLVDILTKAIHNHTYPPTTKLPSVERLAIELNAGRTTVREALRVLETRGLVEIIHGAGTFVRQKPITLVTGQVLSFTEIVQERGMQPSSMILKQEVVKANSEQAAKFNVKVGEQINLLHRLRLADNIPVCVEVSITLYQRFPDLFDRPWTSQTSLYDLLREHYGVQIQYSEHTVRAVGAGRLESQLLKIELKNPVLLVENLTYDGQGHPVEFGRSFYSSSHFEYRVMVRPEPIPQL